MTLDGNIYILQYGSYISRSVMEENTKKLDNYLLFEEDNKYYIYLSIFTSHENALRMQKKYNDKNIHTYLKEDYLGDEKIIEKIKKIENQDKDLEKINEEILNELKKK